MSNTYALVFKILYANFTGFFRLFVKLALYFKTKFLSQGIYNQSFLVLMATAGALSLQYWMGYNSGSLGNNARHGIFSDDYFLIIASLGLSAICAYIPVFAFSMSTRPVLLFAYLKFLLLSVVTFVYIINFLYPERTTPAEEANFSIWFYLFGLNLLLLWVTGVLGLRFKPSTL